MSSVLAILYNILSNINTIRTLIPRNSTKCDTQKATLVLETKTMLAISRLTGFLVALDVLRYIFSYFEIFFYLITNQYISKYFLYN